MQFRRILTALAVLLVAVALCPAQTLPSSVFFFGPAYDPGQAPPQAAAGQIGGAKLVSDSVYLGAVASIGSKGVTPWQAKTSIQFHSAERFWTFRGMPLFWTQEAGPDIAASTAAVSAGSKPVVTNVGTNIGYKAGSGLLVSLPLGRGWYLMPHAEVVKGSLQDLGWKAGVLFALGDK